MVLDEYLSRSTFEGLIDQDVSEAMARVDQVLESAGLRASDIDLALLIGGTSLIPRVRKEMFDRFGVKMVQITNADSIIAEGASLVDALNLHQGHRTSNCTGGKDLRHEVIVPAGGAPFDAQAGVPRTLLRHQVHRQPTQQRQVLRRVV